jgi:hypothetical protein
MSEKLNEMSKLMDAEWKVFVNWMKWSGVHGVLFGAMKELMLGQPKGMSGASVHDCCCVGSY